jgi:hypothetical protein
MDYLPEDHFFGLKKSYADCEISDIKSLLAGTSPHFPTGQEVLASVTFKLTKQPHCLHCFVGRK